MPIRLLINVFQLLLLIGCQRLSLSHLETDWNLYKSLYIASDGRVIDTGNQDISHSEGQGYGMLIAVEMNDKESFEQIWQWTKKNLQVREDKLFMWRKRPGFDLSKEDKNNATDGDIIIAWALQEAAEKWQIPEYFKEAESILRDIKTKLIIDHDGLTVLLPGEFGFQFEDKIIVNMSYWVFPAFKNFSLYDQDQVWLNLMASGRALLQQARYGRWQLPPDWLELSSSESMVPGKEKHFGYDAVRIPLYQHLAKFDKKLLSKFATYWDFYQNYTPSWVSLHENVMDSFGAAPGIQAIKQITLEACDLSNSVKFATVDRTQDYYSATLLLLSQISYRRYYQ